jgi:CheY-like chemotaxis protein
LLAAILGNADLARLDLAASHPARVSVDEITRAGQRAKELVQRILTFSRPQEHQLRTTDLALVVDEAARLLRATIPAGVELRLDIDPVPTVQADASQIHQVILNLVTNAWHAIEGQSGRIELRLESHLIDAEFCQLHPQLQPGEYVCLSVSDTGKGMNAEVLKRIFEPFFTTKPSGQGAGLGLPMVHGIVRAHGGAVIVESRLEVGTRFSIFLPASYAGINDAPAKTALPDSVRGQGQRILYIDDEEPLVYLMVRFLEKIGYHIEGHTGPVAGLAAFRANPTRFDLVITDRNMPGLSGVEVAQQVLQIRPEIPVVLVSGYLLPGEVEQARALGVREVVLKPNSVEGFGPLLQRIFSGQANTAEDGQSLAD